MTAEWLGPVSVWTNSELHVFHGTDALSAKAIGADGVDLSLCRVATDFGQGFYTTTSQQQAYVWAEKKAARKKTSPVVLTFSVDRERLATLETLWFVRGALDAADFWSFVAFCRNGGEQHGRDAARCYDVVAGPVTYSNTFGRATYPDYDQIGFHTVAAVEALKLQS